MSKILLFDIETAPCEAYIWSIWKELGSANMVKNDWYVLCWCAKWLDGKQMFSGRAVDGDDRESMVKLRDLLDEADFVITQNGDKFDIKKVNTRFIIHGIKPPSSFTSIDTLKIAKRHFKFTSNRLDDLGQYLGVGRKLKTGGFELWRRCMAGEEEAFRLMLRYCAQDVRLLERVYLRLRPYYHHHPAVSHGDKLTCRICGGKKLESRGSGVNSSGVYRRFQCQGCGGWLNVKVKREKGKSQNIRCHAQLQN